MIWLTVFALTLGILFVVVFGMAIGVLFGNRKLTGSCGGLANHPSKDGTTNCMLCSNPDAACKTQSLRRKPQSDAL